MSKKNVEKKSRKMSKNGDMSTVFCVNTKKLDVDDGFLIELVQLGTYLGFKSAGVQVAATCDLQDEGIVKKLNYQVTGVQKRLFVA